MAPEERAVRADELLFRLGFAESLPEAAALIMSGRVIANLPDGRERRIDKAGEPLPAASSFRIRGKDHPYVSRGGVKLEHALREFGISARDLVAADIGVSTGGFTDCLLQEGAKRVYALDVGHNQTAWKIRTDPRVRLFERTHAGTMAPGFFGEPIDLLVADLSFIALARVFLALSLQLRPGGDLVALVKPQFELPPEKVEAGGVITDPTLRQEALDRALAAASSTSLECLGCCDSPIPGRDGNLEWLVHLRLGSPERGA